MTCVSTEFFRAIPFVAWTRILMGSAAGAGSSTIHWRSKRLSTEVAEKHGTGGLGDRVGGIL